MLQLDHEDFPADAREAVRTLIRFIGDDPDRPGLLDTPRRFLRAWRETWGAGYRDLPENCLRVFPHEGAVYNQMVFQGGIVFHSFCEHHLAPFFGVAHVAYLAEEGGPGLLGLSKLARIVNHCACRLQVQERLTEQIANTLSGILGPHASVGVQLQASHMCMVSRGVQQPHSLTITTSLCGKILDGQKARDEFLSYCSDASKAPRG
jgi:GTP cyclohydrolase I